MDETGSLASIISGLFSGGTGIAQLLGGGLSGAAGMASPFQSQYANYQSGVGNAIGGIEGQQAGTNANLTGIAGLLQQLAGGFGNQNGAGTIGAGITNLNQAESDYGKLGAYAYGGTPSSIAGAGGNLATQLAELTSNYMSNPAIKSELAQGISATNSGLAAQGLTSSGAQQKALMDYGNNFAAQQYQTQFNNLVTGSTTEFGENTASEQLGMAEQAQGFGQQLQKLGGETSTAQASAGLGSILSQLQQGALGSAGSILGTNSNLLLNSSQGLLNSYEALSGATTGSPSTAGIIESGQFGQTQQAVGNLGSGITGLLSGLLGTGGQSGLLSGLFNQGGGLSGILQSLFGGSSAGIAGDIGSESIGAVSSSTPDDLISAFTG